MIQRYGRETINKEGSNIYLNKIDDEQYFFCKVAIEEGSSIPQGDREAINKRVDKQWSTSGGCD
jgi:hypothetical protein